MKANPLAWHASRKTMPQTTSRAGISNGASFARSINLDQRQSVVQILRGIDGVKQVNVLPFAAQCQRNRPVALVHAGRRFNVNTLGHAPTQHLRKRFPLRRLTKGGTCLADNYTRHRSRPFSQYVVQSETSHAC